MSIVATDHYENLKAYYARAMQLQRINLASDEGRVPAPGQCDDPLQTYVKIYDVVERRYAGFSNALEQLWKGSGTAKRWQARADFDGLHDVLDRSEWMLLFLVHRITGSGASFDHDHGFRNSAVADLALHMAGEIYTRQRKYTAMRWFWARMSERPVFTSIGNQIPSFPKPTEMFPRGSELYLVTHAPQLVEDLDRWLELGERKTIRHVVDWINAWHMAHGVRKFHFVVSAFVMDLAEYYPAVVDPYSHANYGANAYEAMELLFSRPAKLRKKTFYDRVMERCCSDMTDPEGWPSQPMSMEDVLCDYIRYVERYVPKDYLELELWQVTPNYATDRLHMHPTHASYKQILARYEGEALVEQRRRWLEFVNAPASLDARC